MGDGWHLRDETGNQTDLSDLTDQSDHRSISIFSEWWRRAVLYRSRDSCWFELLRLF